MLKPAPDVLTRMLRQPRVRATTYIMRQCVCVYVIHVCNARVGGRRGGRIYMCEHIEIRPFLAMQRTEF